VTAPAAQPPGWHGKLPSLGDFASRRLDASFIEPWDGWLAAGLLALREARPEGWLEDYLGSPSWRFLLMPGVLPGDAGKQAWAGVLMPSVDRVGRYFPLTSRGGATPLQMCQSFCPASATKVFSGNSIDYAVGAMGERYVDTPNAFAYRKALKADCTCNGRDPAGLAPVDLSLDATLRPGDIVATSNGLVAYSGNRTASGQTAEFTPVANYAGLTAELRARLGEMKVAPVSAEVAEDNYTPQDLSLQNTTGALPQPKLMQPAPSKAAPSKVTASAPKIAAPKPRARM